MNKDYSHSYNKRNVATRNATMDNYNKLGQETNMEEPKPRLRDRMDAFFGLFIPVAVATIAIGSLAWLEYLIVTWTWERWKQTVNTHTVHKYQMFGTYHHAVSTDIFWGVIFGILSVAVIIACAYWAEDEYQQAR